MTVNCASNLDIGKFRKVYALVTGGVTEGERMAAEARAEVMAAKAGLTLKQAVSNLDAQPAVKPVNFFEGFDDWMEGKEPGYQSKRAREHAERQTRYAARRSEILKEFGTVRAFMDPTPNELLLLEAGKPFVTKRSSYVDVCGTRRHGASEFAGVAGHLFKLDDVNPNAIVAIKAALPFPACIRDAFEELKVWDKLNRDRAHFYDHHEYYFDLPIELRVELLRDLMRTQPARSWTDLEARFHYKAYDWQQQWVDDLEFEDPEWSRLFDDFRILRAKAEAGRQAAVQSGRRTNAEKRADVLSMLTTGPKLSDREIARRVGVSPQTVNTWRKKSERP